jgi:hypothetical protein
LNKRGSSALFRSNPEKLEIPWRFRGFHVCARHENTNAHRDFE